jgi:hypothetical protein
VKNTGKGGKAKLCLLLVRCIVIRVALQFKKVIVLTGILKKYQIEYYAILLQAGHPGCSLKAAQF